MNKSCKVIMLPTNNVIGVTLWLNPNGQLLHTKMPDSQNGKYKGQHLYIVSDEDVVEGDYHIASHIIKEFPYKCLAYTDKEQLDAIQEIGGALKVIATTNKDLVIEGKAPSGDIAWRHPYPQPSESFVAYYVTEYNKGNMIDEVFIERELRTKIGDVLIKDQSDYDFYLKECMEMEYRVKINPDNTVNLIIKDLTYWEQNAKELYNMTPIGVLKYITELEGYIANTKTKQETEKIAKVAFRMGQQQPTLDFVDFQKWCEEVI